MDRQCATPLFLKQVEGPVQLSKLCNGGSAQLVPNAAGNPTLVAL